MAAFSTNTKDKEQQIIFNRRASQVDEDTSPSDPETSRFAQLQSLLEGPLGEEIIEGIDYRQLQ
jgi:hypothetical protein